MWAVSWDSERIEMRKFPLAFLQKLRNNPHMEKELLDNLRAVTAIFCEATGKTPKYVAWQATNNNKFWDQIDQGGGWNIRTYDKILQWLSDRWPEGAEWPEGVTRPPQKPVEQASEEGAAA
jgi:hypothetical protein